MNRSMLVWAGIAGSVLVAEAGPTWHKKLDDALAAAKRDWKPVVIDAGREA